MKKKISVITLIPRSGRFYARQVRDLFGDRVQVAAYSTKDQSVEKIAPSDLYLLSTDAFKEAEEVRRYIPEGSQVVEIQLTYPLEVIRRLKEIPKEREVLFVNATQQMAREAITQLEQRGVNQLRFIPYGPDSPIPAGVKVAVTPDEPDLVPPGIEEVINIGHRPCAPSTMIETAVRLGFEEILEENPFRNYVKSMATENYSFDKMFFRSRTMESRFDILLEILDEGLVGVNEKGEVFACNRMARDITGAKSPDVVGRNAKEEFPYIPFELHKGYRPKYTFEDVTGKSPALERTKTILRKMAATELPVLLIGETGTGKELLAHAVHQASGRSQSPFVAINVAAMPENLLESELFGYEEGAFTGAKKGGRPGLFEFAHTGTLFLDEVEGMSQAMQVKLLRVLQEREIMRVGGNQIINVDVRIVAATNENLEELVEKGNFRRDLYYRLNALPVLIPPLRERGEDIFLLLDQFRSRANGEFSLSAEVRELFLKYSWPGNVRELQNVTEYLSFMGQKLIRVEDLPPTFLNSLKREPERKESTLPSWKAERPKPQRSPEFWFVLEQLYEAAVRGEMIGRETMWRAARKRQLPLSQKEIRDILEQMSEEGLVKITRGRGGSRITVIGQRMWENKEE